MTPTPASVERLPDSSPRQDLRILAQILGRIERLSYTSKRWLWSALDAELRDEIHG